MCTITAIVNQKGGVAKTTTALALTSRLREMGKRVLAVDLDPQGNFTYATGVEGYSHTVVDVMRREVKADKAVFQDLLASSPHLAASDVTFTQVGKEFLLKEALLPLREKYDFIVLDCPPSLGLLSVAALTAADECVLPCQADMYSLTGLMQMGQTLEAVRTYTNPSLVVSGVLLCRYNARSVISREMLAMIQRTAHDLNTRLFHARIRECSALKEAAALRRPSIFEYAPHSNAAQDYAAFTDEFLANIWR